LFQKPIAGFANISLWHFSSSSLVWSTYIHFSLAPLQAGQIWEAMSSTLLTAHQCSRISCFVYLSAQDSTGAQLAENSYFFSQFNPLQISLPLAQVKIVSVTSTGSNSVNVTIVSDAITLFVQLSTTIPGHFSENGFLLLPQQLRVVSFSGWQGFDIEELQASLSLQFLNSVLHGIIHAT